MTSFQKHLGERCFHSFPHNYTQILNQTMHMVNQSSVYNWFYNRLMINSFNLYIIVTLNDSSFDYEECK